MRCGADRPVRPRRATVLRAVAVLAAGALAACLLAACSFGGKPHSGGHRGISGFGLPGHRRFGGFNRVVVVGGPGGGGFLVVAGLSGPASGRPHITVPPIPPASSVRPINLPLSTYADVTGLQQASLAIANSLLTQKCMAARGFSYSGEATPSAEDSIVQATEYGYGVETPADASRYGYGQPSTGNGQKGLAFLGGFASFGDLRKQPPAWILALLGFAPGVRIGPGRLPGCLQQAGSLIYGPGSQPADPVPMIAIQASQWTQSDPRVVAVQAAWSRCMARRGYKYHTPEQAASANWPTTPTAAETATAIADVGCKLQVNLINTWLTVESAYQTVLIGQDLATLSKLQASFAKILQRAEQALIAPGLPTGIQQPRLRPGQPVQIITNTG